MSSSKTDKSCLLTKKNRTSAQIPILFFGTAARYRLSRSLSSDAFQFPDKKEKKKKNGMERPAIFLDACRFRNEYTLGAVGEIEISSAYRDCIFLYFVQFDKTTLPEETCKTYRGKSRS